MNELNQFDQSIRVVRVYRLKWHRFMVALFFLLIGCTFATGISREWIRGTGEVKPLELTISVLLLIVGLLWTASVVRHK